MQIQIKRTNDAVAMAGINAEGLSVSIDGSAQVGGVGAGPRPMELLLMSLASCTSIDVLHIIKKRRLALKHYEVEVLSRRKDEIPAVFESILLRFVIDPSDPIDEVSKAVELSLEKYCSVRASLHPDIAITYEIVTR